MKRTRSAYEGDTFVIYGTPFRDPVGKPVWEQEVRDERGRKRLHGAFTGGWSAGYFNTVGSKEGWTPASFVSSRSNRNQLTQNVEDFMDDEDLADHVEAVKLETLGGFAGFGRSHGILEGLFQPASEPVGARLLQKIGWKEGAQASEDAPWLKMASRTDRKGVGYDVDDEEPKILPSRKPTKLSNKPKKIINKGIDMGALSGSDPEDDGYLMGPQLNYRQVKLKKKRKPDTSINPEGHNMSNINSLVPGFVRSMVTLSLSSQSKYPFPQVPDGWVSPSSSLQKAADLPMSGAAKVHPNPSPQASLGEQTPPVQSVFDFISPATRDRLAAATGKPNLPPGKGKWPAPCSVKLNPRDEAGNLQSMVPYLDKATALVALQRIESSTTCAPYADNEAKQARYNSFLHRQAEQRPSLPERAPNMSVSDWAQELSEFARAAEVFKPMTGEMATRFAPSGSAAAMAPVEDDPAEKAAKMGMFGPLTRTSMPWMPPRLLCKRFGVPMPKVEGESSNEPKTMDET
ncbi:DUF1604-domain-containing protein [Piedraia hortae CBS 480.64]|uniref:DUF1604-domain-containing protein n=1 Tax=Piedraia hortae CBS 480.64 TaxID=1314780 RepID=A0A6A7C719_9PEZI|nr:DUF1604-domain-containing protein [Piedraia hortae CBS 480.64]